MKNTLPDAPKRRSRKRFLLVGGLLGAAAAAGIARRRLATPPSDAPLETEDERLALGWGAGIATPERRAVRTPDGAELAVWDVAGEGADAPAVVLPHCWGCSHEIWIPVARRLRDQGHRVVLYDQRGHGASTRGTAPLSIETLAHDLEAVLDATSVQDVVLAGHSMGGMTVMSLATYRPDVLKARAKAVVLVSTSASSIGPGSPQLAGAFMSSPLIKPVLHTKNGHVFIRGAFGAEVVPSHVDLTRTTFANCDRKVRGGFAVSFGAMNLLDGIATIDLPTTVMVGTRDTLTVPKRADQIVSSIPGARLVSLKDKGHMLPLEDPDAVTDEIVRAVKG